MSDVCIPTQISIYTWRVPRCFIPLASGYGCRMNVESVENPRERDPQTARKVEIMPDVTRNLSPDDGIMEDDLTEEREITPAQREDVAETQKMDP